MLEKIEEKFTGKYGFKLDFRNDNGMQFSCCDNRDGELHGDLDLENGYLLMAEIKKESENLYVIVDINCESITVFVSEIM